MLSDFIVSWLVWKEIDGSKCFSAQTAIFDPHSPIMYDISQKNLVQVEMQKIYTSHRGTLTPSYVDCFDVYKCNGM